jgi:hypothetical protein
VSHAGEISAANDIVVINGGINNNPWNTLGFVESEMARAVAALPSGSRYVILGIHTFEDVDVYTGGADRSKLDTINANLAATYGGRFLNVDALLKAQSTHSGADATDDSHGITPTSQRQDALHFSVAGHTTVKNGLMVLLSNLGWS